MIQNITGFINAFEDAQESIYDCAVRHGWWERPREDGTCIALMHSELSEALEALRKNKPSDKIPMFTGEEEELADTIIRIMDYAHHKQLNLAAAIIAKAEFNETRPYKHGGKLF